jgi:hypothetical protein
VVAAEGEADDREQARERDVAEQYTVGLLLLLVVGSDAPLGAQEARVAFR